MVISALSSLYVLDESRPYLALRVVDYIHSSKPFMTFGFHTYRPELEGPADGYESSSFTVISGDGGLVAAARGASIVIRDGGSGSHVATLTLPDNRTVTDLRFSCNGMYLAATGQRSSSPFKSDTLAVFTARESQWKICHLWDDGTFTDYQLGAISSDGQLIALIRRFRVPAYISPRGGWNRPHQAGQILVRSIISHKTTDLLWNRWHDEGLFGNHDQDLCRHMVKRSYSCLAFSPDSRVLVGAHMHMKGEIKVWNLDIAADRIQGYNIVPLPLRTYLASSEQEQNLWLEFSRDGKSLSCGNGYDRVLTFALDGSSPEPRFECLTDLDADRVENVSTHRVRWVYVLRE